jgi:hypothetical protein
VTRLVKAAGLVLAAGIAAGFLRGLARRRPTPESVVYVPPEPSGDHRAVGPHLARLAPAPSSGD